MFGLDSACKRSIPSTEPICATMNPLTTTRAGPKDIRMSGPCGFMTVSFSTEDLPEEDRVAMWREHYGKIVFRVDVEPAKDRPFAARITSYVLPGLHLLQGTMSGGRVTRTRALIPAGDDDFGLFVNRGGLIAVFARDRSIQLDKGDAVLLSGDDVTMFERSSYGQYVSHRVPRLVLSSLVANIDDAVMRPIPQRSAALQLLTSYTNSLMDEDVLRLSSLQHVAIGHVYDLLALTLGATCDAAETAKRRGVRAARLQAAKAYIVANSSRRDLSIGAVAAQFGVTPRYLQRLFESDGNTFSAYVLGQRLTQAHRILRKPQLDGRHVSAIAYDVGFGDLSYFNRCFRRLYGVTPSDIRDAGARNASV